MTIDIKKLSDEELTEIKRNLGNGDNDLLAKAAMELSYRRSTKEDVLKQKQLEAVQLGFERIALVVEKLSKKPLKTLIVATVLTVLTGVLINIITTFLTRVLAIIWPIS